MDATSSARLLKPVTETIMHDGAPFVRLSPHKGMRNASIIYEAIRQMPDGTLIRGDYDKKSHPFVYFPERPPKKIGSPIRARNIEADRKELSGFLSSIAGAAYQSAQPHSSLIKAAGDLKLKINAVDASRCDFTVGDIRKSLHTIAKAYAMANLRERTSPHRLVPGQGSHIQGKRFREFVKMDRHKFDQLATALHDQSRSKYDTLPMVAVFEIKQLLKDFLAQPADRKKPFAQFLRMREITPHQRYFAKRWREISSPVPTQQRKDLVTEPWSFEMDKICALIESAQRRKVSTAELGMGIGSPEVRRQVSRLLPDLPPIVAVGDREEASADSPLSPRSPRSLMLSPVSPDTPDDERELERAILSESTLPTLDLDRDVPVDSRNPVSSGGMVMSPRQIVAGHTIAASLHVLPDSLPLQASFLSEALGPMSPRQAVAPQLIAASAHQLPEVALPEELPERRPETAKPPMNPIYVRSDIDWFAGATSNDQNQLVPDSALADPDDLLAQSFVPWHFVKGLMNVDYSPINAGHASQQIASGQTTASPDQVATDESDSTTSYSGPGALRFTGPVRSQPSRMMMYPKVGHSTLQVSTTDEDE